jgi:hypothetical protein
MRRLVVPTYLVAAAVVAVLFGIVAHNDLGIAIEVIRNGALIGAGVVLAVVALGTLLG